MQFVCLKKLTRKNSLLKCMEFNAILKFSRNRKICLYHKSASKNVFVRGAPKYTMKIGVNFTKKNDPMN